MTSDGTTHGRPKLDGVWLKMCCAGMMGRACHLTADFKATLCGRQVEDFPIYGDPVCGACLRKLEGP